MTAELRDVGGDRPHERRRRSAPAQDLGRIHREVEEVTARVRTIELDAGHAPRIARTPLTKSLRTAAACRALRASEEYELAFSEENRWSAS